MKRLYKRYWIAVITVVMIVAARSPGTVYSENDTLNYLEKVNVLHNIAKAVRDSYIDTIDVGVLWDGAIQGMIDKLDPHSGYMPPRQALDFTEKIKGDFEGIGITFSMINDKITVIEVIPNGPSEKSGIRSRDKIVGIDGKNAVGLSIDEVKDKLRGPSRSKVTTLVERPGEDDLLKFTITRGNIEVNSVSHAYMLDDTTGYLAVTRFTLYTHLDVRKALEKLREQGMKRLVFDLRNNSGGSLDTAIGVVDLFIEEGIIVSTKGRRRSDNRTWRAKNYAQDENIPMIVMINHRSASASEIVAGALQDHDRSLIVGQTSFGKGLVMNTMEIKVEGEDNGTLILSVARYYTPSGRLIQRPYTGSREEYIKEGFDDYDPNALDEDKIDKPVYHTDLGREVFGGGGITPDITLESIGTLNKLEWELRNANLFFEFADGYLERHPEVPLDFKTFLSEYRVPTDEFERFKQFAVDKDVKINNVSLFRNDLNEIFKKYDILSEAGEKLEQILVNSGINLDETLFEKSRDFIEREIKQEIARMLWGSDERYKVWHTSDNELHEALTYFDEAEGLLEKRLALGENAKDE